MNPLIHLNYRIWNLWTPDAWWSRWTPESCAKKLPLFTSPKIMKDIVFRMCYLAGLGNIPYGAANEWTLDLWLATDEWLKKQTS